MYEHRSKPLISRDRFIRRVTFHVLLAFGIITLSLAIGIAGYVGFEDMAFIDALLNASMLLGGMGPVGELHTTMGKLFASFYSLFSGIVFLVAAGIIVAPLIHRFLHRFHLDDEA